MGGWVKVHRQIQDSVVWTGASEFQKVLLLVILLNVNHQEQEWEWRGERYRAKPGQMVTSIASLVRLVGRGATESKVRTGLLRLKRLGFLAIDTSSQSRLLTVVNWEEHQTQGAARDLDENENENHKPIANRSQADRKLIATNKKDKNEKKGEKVITALRTTSSDKKQYGDFVYLGEEEYRKLVTDFGEVGTHQMIEILDHYKGASGRKYQSDYRGILSWVVNRWQSDEQKRRRFFSKTSEVMSDAERLARGESIEDLSA